MKLVKKLLCLLIVINTLGIHFSTSSIPPSLADQVEKTLTSCFADRLNPVIISEDLTDIVYKGATDFPVLVISEDFKAHTIRVFNPRYPTYVLSVNSVKKLEATLKELATLSTWSVESVFFVICRSKAICDEDGRKVLELLWNMNQLTAFYICSGSIYTVNPFSNRVPLPWQEVPHTRLIVQSQGHNGENRPILFKRPYENDPTLCPSLKFEKTEHLDGYPVKAILDSSIEKKLNSNGTVEVEDLRQSLPYTQYKYFETLFSVLNVTPVINYNEIGNYTTDNLRGLVHALVNGTYDVCLNYKYVTTPGYEFIDIVNPNIQNKVFILTHSGGIQKPIENNRIGDNFTNFTFVLISILVLVLSYVIIIITKIYNLNYVNNHVGVADDDNDPEYGDSFLDILRMILSTGIMTPLNSTSMRIMFITTTLLVFMVSPKLQGEITSSSTKQEYNYPTTMKDLIDLKYNIYIWSGVRNEFIARKDEYNMDLDYLHSIIDFRECHTMILKDPTTACVFYLGNQIKMANKYNFPLALSYEFESYRFFWSKKNWPLKKKIDSLTLKFREAGLMNYWLEKTFGLPLKMLRAKEASKSLSEYVPTEFDDLKLLYTWLAGLAIGLSVFAFAIEVLTARIKFRRRQRFINERRRKLKAKVQKFKEDNVNDRFLQDKVRIVRGRVVILP